MTITEFLRARLDEDAMVARDASPGPWHTDAEAHEVLAVDDILVADGFALSGPQTRATTRHIARHDPARVLVDIDAKYGIVAMHRSYEQILRDEAHTEAEQMASRTAVYAVGIICQALAQQYADHPDFDPAWRVA